MKEGIREDSYLNKFLEKENTPVEVCKPPKDLTLKMMDMSDERLKEFEDELGEKVEKRGIENMDSSKVLSLFSMIETIKDIRGL